MLQSISLFIHCGTASTEGRLREPHNYPKIQWLEHSDTGHPCSNTLAPYNRGRNWIWVSHILAECLTTELRVIKLGITNITFSSGHILHEIQSARQPQACLLDQVPQTAQASKHPYLPQVCESLWGTGWETGTWTFRGWEQHACPEAETQAPTWFARSFADVEPILELGHPSPRFRCLGTVVDLGHCQ